MDEKTPTRPFDPGNVLFGTGEDGDRDEAACMALSGVGDPANADVLLVTFTGTTRERLDAWKRHADAPPANIGVVSVESGSSSGNNGDDGGGPPVRHVSDPSDLTGVNIAISEFLSGWADTSNRTLVCFESLTALLQYADSERVFQFCNEITSKFERAGASAHFHVTTEAHEPRVLNGLSSLFEGRVAATDVDCGVDASEAHDTPESADAADGSHVRDVDDTPDAADSSDASDTSDPDGPDEDLEAETSGLTARASEPEAEVASVDDPFVYGEARTTPDETGESASARPLDADGPDGSIEPDETTEPDGASDADVAAAIEVTGLEDDGPSGHHRRSQGHGSNPSVPTKDGDDSRGESGRGTTADAEDGGSGPPEPSPPTTAADGPGGSSPERNALYQRTTATVVGVVAMVVLISVLAAAMPLPVGVDGPDGDAADVGTTQTPSSAAVTDATETETDAATADAATPSPTPSPTSTDTPTPERSTSTPEQSAPTPEPTPEPTETADDSGLTDAVAGENGVVDGVTGVVDGGDGDESDDEAGLLDL